MAKISNLKCENRICPIGIDVTRPRFSWELSGGTQKGYSITVQAETGEYVWQSGRVESPRHIQIEYAGKILQPATRYTWTVETEDDCKASYFETGLMGGEFGAWFIRAQNNGPAYIRKSFDVSAKVKRAVIRASALGVYELSINGNPAGNELLSPGWTSYESRLQYQTWDITDMLTRGENVIGVRLAEGWYRGDIITFHRKTLEKTAPLFICSLELVYEDGVVETIATDADWKTTNDIPLLECDFYQGVEYDACKEIPGWDKPGFDDSAWKAAKVSEEKRNLIGQLDPPVRRIGRLKPISVITTPKGETVLDFGQNMVGFVCFSVKGEAGRRVTIRHAEVLDGEGNFYTQNYRAAKAEINYTLKGGAPESFEPPLTFYGFRYIKLENWPCEVLPGDFTGVVICSDLEPTSGFECSDMDVNRLFSNIIWGQRGNFVDVPTDCPQRDERMGWTGDCQAFARTACINMDCDLMLSEWLKDLAADQRQDGAVTHVVPHCMGSGSAGSAAWGDAATIVPWTLYQCFGDRRVLENQYPSMRRWLDFIMSQSEGYLWSKGKHFGDWLGLDAYEGSYVGATDTTLIATAFWAYSAEITLKTARVLGYQSDVNELMELVENIRAAYRREFITMTGRLAVNTQTAYVLTLHFNLCAEADRPRIIRDFAALIERSNNHLTTGFVGTPYLCLTLSECGLHELAGKLFLNRDYPSWLYPISKGATTMWEHWDGIKPDGSFWSSDMNSYNHYAYGAIGEWMFRKLAGIEPAAPGYEKLELSPMPIDGLDYVSAWQKTPCGTVKCGWKREENGAYTIECAVPCGVPAVLVFGGEKRELEPGAHIFRY